MRKLLPFIFIGFYFSCKQENKIPNDIIEQNRMQGLMWDMIRADAFMTNFAGKGDSTFNIFKESIPLYLEVFEIHKTNKEQFTKSLEWYQKHPVVMKIILDTIQSKQKKILEERSKPATSIPVDTLKS